MLRSRVLGLRVFGRLASCLAIVMIASPVLAEVPSTVGGARLEPVSFSTLPGWREDDHAAAFATFLRSCTAMETAEPESQPAMALAVGRGLAAICRAALAHRPKGRAAIRRFFEDNFAAFRVRPADGEGFLTGYFEPEYRGRLKPDATYTTPLLARPDDLVTLQPRQQVAGLDPALSAARRSQRGLEPYPDRAAIEDGALGAAAKPLAWLDPVDAYFAHVQGSVRVRLASGQVLRFAYAGKNGRHYRSLGRLVAEETGLPPAQLTAPQLIAWLRANPADARRLMRENGSYIFFRPATELDPAEGPLGGSSVQLVPGRSIAIDRTLWPYGLPFWIDASLPAPGADEPFRRLMIAQDTGSAIRGPARADIFVGMGPAAGHRAGLFRHAGRFVVLLPKEPAGAGGKP
jgi:membrane-bound lytic murein transglycosylase A